MSINESNRKITVVSAGSSPVEFVDDVFTNTRHSIASGDLLHKGANGGGWEGPTPLPGPPQEKAHGAEPGDGGWQRPIDLYGLDPEAFEVVADSPEDLTTGPKAFAALAKGETVRVRVRNADGFALSRISSLAEAAQATPGKIEVELHGDG